MIELSLKRDQRISAKDMLQIIKTDIKNLQDIAPLIDDDIIEIYNGKYRRYKRVKKPNFVNGLTEVKINPYNNEREYEFASRQGSREASPNNELRDDVHQPSPPQQPPQQAVSLRFKRLRKKSSSSSTTTKKLRKKTKRCSWKTTSPRPTLTRRRRLPTTASRSPSRPPCAFSSPLRWSREASTTVTT